MTIQQRILRDSKIIKYKIEERHTVLQTARKFNLCINQIFRILRKYRKQHERL